MRRVISDCDSLRIALTVPSSLRQIAVDNGFGGVYGQQKAAWLVDVLQQYFHDNGELHYSFYQWRPVDLWAD